MRDDLVGYLLDALEPAEKLAIEAQLSRDAALRQDLETLRGKMQLLEVDRAHYTPPPGLAERTCEFVYSRIEVALTPATPAPARWRLVDFAVAAAIFLAASVLFLPALHQSRLAAGVTGCQNNLRELGRSLAQFANVNGGRFPSLDHGEGQFPAGVYATKLSDKGLLLEPSMVICPSSAQATQLEQFRLPALDEIQNASRQRQAELYRAMGGSYGYNLGYLLDGRYHSTENLQRPTFALMADAPDSETLRGSTVPAQLSSLNHGRRGQNVLFEDGHVEFLKGCNAEGCPDNIFLNDHGQPTAGIHRNDAVIGPSHAHPLPAGSSDSR
ncbi:MAG TPA: hypothetical protein VHY91_19210 [Pirellulales bacterium]|jgi:hypothetical protein|nr:hypothetical protein [Pirellulales bacterium]